MSTPVKKQTWTLAMIKAANQKAGRLFFSLGNMAHAGDTMNNFRVINDKHEGKLTGRVFIERKKATWKGFQPSVWRFFPEDGALRFEMNPPLARK